MKLTKKTLQAVDEFGRPVTNISSITVQNVGGSVSKTIYRDPNKELTITNPITTSSTNTTLEQHRGLFWFWSYGPDYKIVITDGTLSRTIDNLTNSDARILFASDLGD